MRAIFRISGNESQQGLQLVKKLRCVPETVSDSILQDPAALLHQQVLVLWCLGTNCILSWPHAINLRLRRVGVTDSWDFKMAVYYIVVTLPRTQTSLSLPMKMCAQRKAERRQRARCTLPMVPCGSSPVTRVSRSPLSFVIHSHHSLHNLYLVVSALFIVVFRLSRCGAPC